MSGKFSGRCSSSWVGSVLPGLPVWGAHPDLCSLWGQKHHLPPTLANASRAARHRQSHLVFSPQASFSFLYIQLCVERTVCNRQYRPVKCLKWRISGNLSSALLISGTDSNKTEGKGVGGSRSPELTAVGPWSPSLRPLLWAHTALRGWGGGAPAPRSQAPLCHESPVQPWEQSLTSVNLAFPFGRWKCQRDTKIQH